MLKENQRLELPVIQTGNNYPLKPPTENPCFSCGACCKNSWFERVSKSELQLLARRAPEVVEITRKSSHNPRAELSDLHDDSSRLSGLRFMIVNDDSRIVSLKGNCSEFGADGRCQIYNQRPRLCVDMEVGGASCNKRRKLAGLPTIRPDGTVIPVETFRHRVNNLVKQFAIKILPVGMGGGF